MNLRTMISCTTGAIIAIFFPINNMFALVEQKPPLDLQIQVNQTTMNLGEPIMVLLTIHNNSKATISSLVVSPSKEEFYVKDIAPLPTSLDVFGSVQGKFQWTGKKPGKFNIIYTLEYDSEAPSSGTKAHWVQTVSMDDVEIIDPWQIKWLDLFVPLLVGFLIAQLGTLLSDWRKRSEDDRQKQQQAVGISVIILQNARKSIEKREQVSFMLWEEGLVKGQLFPALHQYGRLTRKPHLSREMSEIWVNLKDYNNRKQEGFLTVEEANKLITKIDEVLKLYEEQ